MSQRVLITGATGFVGTRLSRALARDGAEVVALARDPARAKRSAPHLADAFEWSALDDDRRTEALRADAVVNLAGEPVAALWTSARKERIERSRVEGTRALVGALAAIERRPSVLVSTSAVGYYGDPGDGEVTEEHAPGSGFLAHVCEEWEREARRAEELGMRVVILRVGIVLGAEGGTLGAMLPAFKAGVGGRIGRGRQIWPWIHIDDLVALYRRAIDDPRFSGVYNAVAPSPVSQMEVAKTLASLLHRPAFVPAPALPLKTLLGEFADEMLLSRRVVPRRAIEAGFTFEHPELEPALRDLLSAEARARRVAS